MAAFRPDSASAAPWVDTAWPRGNSSCSTPSADHDGGRRREFVIGNGEVLGCRPLANARRGVVLRAVARAEITAELAAIIAFVDPQRDAAEVGANAQGDQPVLL